MMCTEARGCVLQREGLCEGVEADAQGMQLSEILSWLALKGPDELTKRGYYTVGCVAWWCTRMQTGRAVCQRDSLCSSDSTVATGYVAWRCGAHPWANRAGVCSRDSLCYLGRRSYLTLVSVANINYTVSGAVLLYLALTSLFMNPQDRGFALGYRIFTRYQSLE